MARLETKSNFVVIAHLVAHAGVYKFVWYGGEYIDVFALGQESAVDVINVWDYEKGEPRLSFDLDGFTIALDEYLADVRMAV